MMGETSNNSDKKTACPYYFFHDGLNLCKITADVKCDYQQLETTTELTLPNYCGKVCGCKKIVQTRIDGSGHSTLEKELSKEMIEIKGKSSISPSVGVGKAYSRLDDFMRC